MKTQTQHTPGPWYLDAHDEKGWFLLSESGPDIMAEPFDCSDSDARLIASAPDMFLALETLLSDRSCPSFLTLEEWRNTHPEFRETLRKARGEA